jgi:hypothetical protein
MTLQAIQTFSMGNKMKKRLFLLFTLSLIATFIISACGSSEPRPTRTPKPTKTTQATKPAVPLATATPDPCAPENIPAEVEKVHKLMREFDDASLLASNTPIDQLNPSIADLQRIRRDAEDQSVPSCLTTLKQYQLAHMNTVINTMLFMLSYQGSDDETETLNQGIALARQQHDQYVLELANVLGLTVVAAPTAAPTQGTPVAGETPVPAPLLIINPGPTAVNLRNQPDLNADNIGILDIGASAVVLGRTADALWYQVEFPGQAGQIAWVYASLVQLSDPTAELQVVEPTP